MPVTGAGAPLERVVVTSLQDAGPGTLREAVSRGSRRIEFQVGGEIRLARMLEVAVNDLTIDGTSAPAPGITITGKPFALAGVQRAVLKNLRFRNSEDDNLRIIGACRDVLVENCSSTHGGDGAIDITQDYKTQARPAGIVIRHCLLGATDKAMLVVGVDQLTLTGNLFTNNGQRNPQLHDARNFNLINNHIRNFATYGVRVRAGSSGNVVGNLVPLSPVIPKRPDRAFLMDHSKAPCRIYTRDNLGPAGHDPDALGNASGPIGKLPSTGRSAVNLAASLEGIVGARPLDSVDQTLVRDNPSIPFRPSKTKDP